LLARLAEGHPESALALASAALEAHEFAEARASLAPLLAAPTKRVATLMARLEDAEHGDTGRAREWMARAVHAAHDPVWTADGVIAESWMPVSPVSGRLDAFQWRVPFADLTPRGPLIEQAGRQLSPSPPAPVAIEAKVERDAAPAAPPPEPPAASEPEMPAQPAFTPAAASDGLPAHAPDDPGPEPESAVEPVAKPGSDAAGILRSWFARGLAKPASTKN
jgi:HemY protein